MKTKAEPEEPEEVRLSPVAVRQTEVSVLGKRLIEGCQKSGRLRRRPGAA